MTHGNYTNAEYYNVFGTLPPERIEALIAIEETARCDGLAGVQAHLEEARGFPIEEDFLSGVTKKIREVHDRTRGENRDNLSHVLAMLDDLEMIAHNAMDYQSSEINEALNMVIALRKAAA